MCHIHTESGGYYLLAQASTSRGVNMTWESPPLHRQLSTIGIGEVFISVPENDGSSASSCSDQINQSLLTSEIVCDIKRKPEDFIVREIGLGGDIAGVSRSKDIGEIVGLSGDIAGITKSSKGVEDTKLLIDNTAKIEDNGTTAHISSITQPQQSSKSATNTNTEVTNIDTNPEEGLQRILTQCCTQDMKDNKSDQHVRKLLRQMKDLQQFALDGIDSPTSKMDDDKMVWIPTAALVTKEDRKLLHQYIRQVFCFLRTETSSRDNKDTANNPLQNDTTDAVNNKSWVCCLIDYAFFSIVPCLAHPCEDLQLLYKFRNDGPIPSSLGGDGRGSSHRGKHHKRKFNGRGGENLVKQEECNPTKGTVILRLKPDLPRDERRVIHKALCSSNRRRDFDTSTQHDVKLDPSNKESDQTTTAIVVQWSRNALQAKKKKRKRTEPGSDAAIEKSTEITALLGVLRKYQIEHQVALNQISRAVKCRNSDIGVAGIKDMQAITYQYCTLRNVSLGRVQQANNILGKRVQLSDFVEIKGAEALLVRGNLIGNRFELVLRNLKRMQRKSEEGEDNYTERPVPVHSSHLDTMIKRIDVHGFINFYGEQRLGDPGSRDYVGVRSFDIGQAMLKGDFDKAIDLLMTGRSTNVYNPNDYEINARNVWKKNRDARASLTSFPKNRNTMVREREVLTGFLRYADALEAFRCLPHNTRMFYINSYQSLIWNRVATERIKRLGPSPVVGDLYISESTGDEEGNVQVVTDPSQVDISQVVLPLPGYNIQYPTNEIGELYKQILKDDDIDLATKNNIPESTAKGSYRCLIVKATNLQWEPLTKSEGLNDDPVITDAKLTFDLKKGCYATMMLRELLMTTMARDCNTRDKDSSKED